MSQLIPSRGADRRVSGSARRRVVQFAPLAILPLEARQMLTAGPLGLNLDSSLEFVDAMKEVRDWAPALGQSTLTRDARGWPTTDASIVIFDQRVNMFWNGPDPNAVQPDIGGTYTLTFQGRAVVSEIGSAELAVRNQTYNPVTNTTTAQVVVTHNTSALLNLNFANTTNLASSTGTGVADVKFFRPGYDPSTTQLFTTRYLNALAPAGTLRYLNLDAANNYGPTLDANGQLAPLRWSQRRLPGASSQGDTYNGGVGASWENMIALANATKTNMWINVPDSADDDYVTRLASLLKGGDIVDGVAYAGLDPSLKVYVEYSNEVWGGTPLPAAYNYEAAKQAVAAGDKALNSDGSTDPGRWAQRYYLERSAQISTLFRNVFGTTATTAQVRPVVEWWGEQLSYFEQVFPWFEGNFGAPSQYFYGMGYANYYNPSDYSSVDAAINSMIAQEPQMMATAAQFTTVATYYGLKNVAYEGGPGLVATTAENTPIALATSRDPRMEKIVQDNYLNWYAAGGDVANFFDGPYGFWSPQNEWTAAEQAQADNPSLAAKYRGLVDVANASPVTPTIGTAIAAASPTNLSITSDSLGTSFARPVSGEENFWLLNVGTAGTYNLTMTTLANPGAASNYAPAQIQVSTGDSNIIGTFSITQYNTFNLGPITLHAGLNTLMIRTIHGSIDGTTIINAFGLEFQPGTLTISPAGYPIPINRSVGGSATASLENSAIGETAPQSFDGQSTTKWSAPSNTAWLQYQFGGGSSYAINQYSMAAAYDTSTYPGRAPKNWTFLGSNDGCNLVDPGHPDEPGRYIVSGDTRTFSIANSTPYRYYRLNMTAAVGTNILQLGEVQLISGAIATALPVSNQATGGTATSSSENSANGEGAAQAFDGRANSKWLTFSNSGWIQYQFGGGMGYAVTQYALTAGADTSVYTGRAPKNWAFLGSNDGFGWTTLDTQTNQADTVSGNTRTFSIGNTTSYRYYRLNVTASNGAPIIQLAELQLLASASSVTAPTVVNQATGGSATAVADNSANGEGAAQAFDGRADSKWLIFANAGWIQYQFGGGASYPVTQYALTAGADTSLYPARAPKNWTFLGSNDGATWSTLDTQTNQADTVSGNTRTFSIGNTTSFRYYRLNVTASNGAPIIQLAELQLLAAPSSGTAPTITNRATGGSSSASAENSANGEGGRAGVRRQGQLQMAHLLQLRLDSVPVRRRFELHRHPVHADRRGRYLALPGPSPEELDVPRLQRRRNLVHPGHPDESGRHRQREHPDLLDRQHDVLPLLPAERDGKQRGADHPACRTPTPRLSGKSR